MAHDSPDFRRRLIRRMITFLYPIRFLALIACSIVVARIALEVVAVYFISPFVTTVTNQLSTGGRADGFFSWLFSDASSAKDLRRVLGFMAASQVGLSLATFLASVWERRLSMGIITAMRTQVYDHLQHLEFSFYDRMTSGKLMNRALGDLDAVHGFVNMSLLATLNIVVSITAYMALLCWRSPYLLFAALIPLPLWCYVIFKFSKRSAPLYGSQQQAADAMLGVITENVAGKHVVRAFGSQKFESRKFTEKNEHFLTRLLSVIRWQATLNPMLQSLAILAHITMFFVCSWLIHRGALPIGDLMILGAAMGTILGKLNHINSIAESFQRAMVSGTRLFEILDAEPTRPRLEGSEKIPSLRQDVIFESVSFAYESGKPVLKNVSCRIPGGQVTALIGPTGAGKTTLSALLARFYDPSSGRITLGDQDITRVNLHELRRHVGFVFQETFLFTDTIRNNIRYGRMDVSEEMLRRAAEASHADDFIRRLPDGYETRIGEGGVQLSGGQRQRLALARALVYDPEVLILDDAMAALDATTESMVRERLRELKSGRTILMITHRPSSLLLADHVIAMEDGRILAEGPPRELAREGGILETFQEGTA